jgi:hypothetical protein
MLRTENVGSMPIFFKSSSLPVPMASDLKHHKIINYTDAKALASVSSKINGRNISWQCLTCLTYNPVVFLGWAKTCEGSVCESIVSHREAKYRSPRK